MLFVINARATTTVTGTVLTPAEAAVTENAFVRFELKNYGNNRPRIIGSNTILPSSVDIYPDAFGQLTTTLTGNELIDPGNTWYDITYFKGGTRFYKCSVYVPSLLTGTVNTNGLVVTWVSSSNFPYYLDASGNDYSFDWVGSAILINSVSYTIASVDSATQLTLTATAGVQAGVAFSHGANTFNVDNATCLNSVPASAIAFGSCPICPPGATGATGATGPTGPQGPAGDSNPSGVLNTMINRWASLVYDCHTTVAGPISKAIAIFEEWDDTATSAQTCPNATYTFPTRSFITGSSASSFHYVETEDNSWTLRANPELSVRTTVSDKTAGARRWIGWTNAATLNMVATDNPTGDVIAFWNCGFFNIVGCNPDSGQDIYCVTKKSGSTINRVDSGIDFVVGQNYLFQIFYNSSTDTATFKIDGTTVCTMNTDMPVDLTNMHFLNLINNTSGTRTYQMDMHGAFLYSAIPVP